MKQEDIRNCTTKKQRHIREKKFETACKPETSWKGTSISGGNYGKDGEMFGAQQMMFFLDVYLSQI